jgi:hypothetical protein
MNNKYDYIKPDKSRNVLSHMKQMEYNEKYSKQLDYIKYISNKYNAEFRIYGSFNTKLHIDKVSDIDVQLFTDEPYVLYHKLKNEINYRKIMQREYDYSMPCKMNKCKGKGITYKINFVYEGVEISFMIINNKDKSFFIEENKEKDWIMYYFGFVLYIIKFIYYKLKLISKSLYKKIKYELFRFPLYTNYNIEFKDVVINNKI